MLKIGSYTLKSKLILAPLSGCTDLPFRTICRAHDCKFAFYEMLDAHGLTYGHKKTLEMLESDKKDSPIGAQILGSDPDRCLEAANIILAHSKPKIIDLNFACPAKKVLKKKCGSALLENPKQAGKIVKKLSSSLHLPVTVKVRAGYNTNDGKEGILLSRICEDNGVSAVFFHGRSMRQGYSGRVNYEAIKQAKEALKVPLLGSGDVFSAELAKNMLDKTGCDGVLIARGAFGAPWIFDQTEMFLKNPSSPPEPVSYEMIVDTAKKHLQIFKGWKDRDKRHQHPIPANKCQSKNKGSVSSGPAPEKYYIGHLRKVAMWYSKGLPYSKRAREAISSANSFNEIIEILDRLKNDYDIKWLKR
ncbi:MAG: tRNA-dihydrouridine synthase [Candidatus Omnitrophica bacterium]|nr:tRNA-dihydrouridine synthase [Candidatus Omnitrophota bacterium]